jgi:N-acetylmuramoyl-L-alanine amidase
MQREINKIVIHCADTPDNSKHVFTVEDIDEWHYERGFRRKEGLREQFNPHLKSCGYHYVIYRDGSVHTGRGENEIGAHAVGHNSGSIGICLIGHSMFTPEQWTALKTLLGTLQRKYRFAVVNGHYQVAKNGKTCPNFTIPDFIARSFAPEEKHVYRG